MAKDILSLTHARSTKERMGLVHHVTDVRHLTDSTFVLTIERHNVPATAGQCVTLGITGDGINREYSLYSGENDAYFSFLIRAIEDGYVTTKLQACAPGDKVDLDGPYGRFIIEEPDDTSKKYLFISTGVGIAPFHSFITSYPQLDYTLLHGVRYCNERYDMEVYDRNRYISCITQESGGDFSGRVTDYLRKYPPEKNTCCYLCGNNAMISEAYDVLREAGVEGNTLFTEIFF